MEEISNNKPKNLLIHLIWKKYKNLKQNWNNIFDFYFYQEISVLLQCAILATQLRANKSLQTIHACAYIEWKEIEETREKIHVL